MNLTVGYVLLVAVLTIPLLLVAFACKEKLWGLDDRLRKQEMSIKIKMKCIKYLRNEVRKYRAEKEKEPDQKTSINLFNSDNLRSNTNH